MSTALLNLLRQIRGVLSYIFILLSKPVCVRGRVWVTFIIRGLVGGFWGCAAALGVLAAAGRLTAHLPVFTIHLSLRGDKSVTYLDEIAACGCENSVQSSDLLLAGPAEGEAVVLFLAFFLRLDDSILLKLDETVVEVPRPEAGKPDNRHVEYSSFWLKPRSGF